mmetsp:Transcript_15533/g.62546  ORF Transcript_15533/g.62546 Transcript_15533/m.62546 type:complete len:105 (-) Transcript_15533:317-631(-)
MAGFEPEGAAGALDDDPSDFEAAARMPPYYSSSDGEFLGGGPSGSAASAARRRARPARSYAGNTNPDDGYRIGDVDDDDDDDYNQKRGPDAECGPFDNDDDMAI